MFISLMVQEPLHSSPALAWHSGTLGTPAQAIAEPLTWSCTCAVFMRWIAEKHLWSGAPGSARLGAAVLGTPELPQAAPHRQAYGARAFTKRHRSPVTLRATVPRVSKPPPLPSQVGGARDYSEALNFGALVRKPCHWLSQPCHRVRPRSSVAQCVNRT